MAAPTCVRAAPLVAIAPASQTAAPGAALSYTVSVTNKSSAACAASTFALAQTLPAGFSGSFGVSGLSLAPGATGSSAWTVTSASSVLDATYTLTAAVSDAASGLSATAHASGVVYGGSLCTTSAPLVSVAPATQSGAAGATLPYTVTVTNRNSSGCGTSTFSLGQTLPSGFTGTLGAASITVAPGASASSAWAVGVGGTVVAGTYGLSARASDSATGTAASGSASSVIVAADTAGPVLSITSPAPGAVLSGRSVALNASASDVSGVKAVEFHVDNRLLATDTSAPYSANWNLRKAAKGAHTIRVRAVDLLGNASEQTLSVTVQ